MLHANDKRGVVERLVALLSILLLVPMIRRMRRHEEPRRRHFPIFGH